MKLTRLVTRAFRNLEDADLATDAPCVVFHGENAQGKTNALEAIFLLATLRPLRGHRPRDLVRWGEDEASVAGWVDGPMGVRRHRVDIGARRRIQVDGEQVRDLGEYFSSVRVIAFTPLDGRIVTDEPELRRRWLDRAAFTAQPSHLARVRTFQRTLSQKAAALREGSDASVLDVLDEQLARAGADLVVHRDRMVEELRPWISHEHAFIAGTEGQVEVRYRTCAQGADLAERTEALRQQFAGSRAGEVRRRMCLAGPQKDEVVFTLDDKPARHFGSRGQVRSLVLALKLAELVAARERGDVPMFLLDDLSSELDRARTGRLVSRLLSLDSQVFVTTTTPEHLGELPEATGLRVKVEDGRLVPEDA